MPIRAVFLDLDDTLCDTIGCRPQRVRAALAHVCARLGRTDLDLDALVARTVDPLERWPAPDHLDALARTEARFHALIDELAPTDTAMLAAAGEIFSTDYTALCFFPDVEETLAHLADTYLLGIISNAPAWQQNKVAYLRLERFVRHITLSGIVGDEKPDPRIFAAALAEAGVQPDEAVFVGDRLNIDVAGAKAAGMRAVWCNHRGDPLIDGLPPPDITITRFAELPGALTAMAAPERYPTPKRCIYTEGHHRGATMATTTRRRIYYPESDGRPMGETEVHVFELIRILTTLHAWFRRAADIYVGGDMMFYYEEGNPKASLSPDVFVVFGVPTTPPRRTYKLWEEGVPPAAVFEITSHKTRREDLGKKHDLYERIGVREYILYDPLDEYLHPPLQGFRLIEGAYAPIIPEPDGALHSEALGLALRLVEGRLRLFDRTSGVELLSPEERADAEAARAEIAEARVAELEARLRGANGRQD